MNTLPASNSWKECSLALAPQSLTVHPFGLVPQALPLLTPAKHCASHQRLGHARSCGSPGEARSFLHCERGGGLMFHCAHSARHEKHTLGLRLMKEWLHGLQISDPHMLTCKGLVDQFDAVVFMRGLNHIDIPRQAKRYASAVFYAIFLP